MLVFCERLHYSVSIFPIQPLLLIQCAHLLDSSCAAVLDVPLCATLFPGNVLKLSFRAHVLPEGHQQRVAHDGARAKDSDHRATEACAGPSGCYYKREISAIKATLCEKRAYSVRYIYQVICLSCFWTNGNRGG